jgi:hypothetical protein
MKRIGKEEIATANIERPLWVQALQSEEMACLRCANLATPKASRNEPQNSEEST